MSLLIKSRHGRLYSTTTTNMSLLWRQHQQQLTTNTPRCCLVQRSTTKPQPFRKCRLSSSSSGGSGSTNTTTSGATAATNTTTTAANNAATPKSSSSSNYTVPPPSQRFVPLPPAENRPDAVRGPVSWTMLFLVSIAAASSVAYYKIERERRLEEAMKKVVTSESDGWSPNPNTLAKRKWKHTPWGWFPEEDAFGPAGKPAVGGPWSLVDLDGNLVTNANFKGKWLLLYFGFARCPDICPSEMMKVAKVMDTMSKNHPQLREKLVPVFVSVDPARDSLKALRHYGDDFHPSYVFLTGSPSQVHAMAKKYRVYVSKADESEIDGDYLVDHSIVIYFHDDEGDLADCFTQSMRPSDIVEKIVERMNFVPTF